MTLAAFQKSTIVRVRNLGLRSFYRSADVVAPGLAGRMARDLWFTLPPKLAATPLPQGAEPFSVALRGAQVRGHVFGEGPVVYLVHGWGGLGSQLAAFVEPLVATGHRVVLFDAPSHGDSDPGAAGPRRTHGVELGQALDAVFARFGPAEAVVAHSLGAVSTYLALRFGWLGTERLVLVAPMVDAESLFDQFQAALGFGVGPAARSTGRSTSSSASRWPSSTRSCSRRTSTRCRPSSCTTAATGRRRTPTPSGWSALSPTRGWSPPRDSGTGGSCATPPWSPRWSTSCATASAPSPPDGSAGQPVTWCR